MGSIRPLVTITILVVVGAYLYTKINEGPVKLHTSASENQPAEGVPPLATTGGASLATDATAPAWPAAAPPTATPTTPPLAAGAAASSTDVAGATAVGVPSGADSMKDALPAVPAIPELPALPTMTETSPATTTPASAQPTVTLPADIPTARYPDAPGQNASAGNANDAANPITPLATIPPIAAAATMPPKTAEPPAAAPPISNQDAPKLESPATARDATLPPVSAAGAGTVDPTLPQASSQNPLRQSPSTTPATEPDRYATAGTTQSVPDYLSGKAAAGASTPNASAPAAAATFAASWPTIQAALDRGDLKQAHQMLSNWHNAESLSPTDAEKVETLLGQLAGTVIYSNEHQLEPARVVKPGETLETIAKEYNVPWQLLAKINNIQAPDQLRPGQELKVVRGPFSAVVDLGRNELTLQVAGYYAGKFPVTVSPGTTVAEGQWLVDQKLTGPPSTAAPTVYAAAPAAADRTIVLRSESNPTAAPGGPTLMIASGTPPAGPGVASPAIRVAPQDAEELSDILSVGSRVVVLR